MFPGKDFILNFLRHRGYYIQPKDWLSLGTHLPTDLTSLGWNRDDKKVIFDVGANVGRFTQELRNAFPNIKAHCFEPNPEVFKQLEARIAGEGIVLNNAGLGCFAGHLDLTTGISSEYSSLVPSKRLLEEKSGSVKVPIFTCDEYCKRNGIDFVDLMKVDVEGFELEVLKGTRKSLANTRILMCEARFGPHEYPGVQISELIDYLTPLNFRFLSLFNGTSRSNVIYNYGDALFVNQDLV